MAHSNKQSSSRRRCLSEDNRAIEGLPIRLVIALIIGIVSLGIMLQILGGIDDFGADTEVDVDFHEDDYIELDDNDNSFTLQVLDEDGQTVPDATVIATGETARMDAVVEETDDDGELTFNFRDEGLELPPDADTGTIAFEVEPPTDSDWTDSEPNNELIVVS